MQRMERTPPKAFSFIKALLTEESNYNYLSTVYMKNLRRQDIGESRKDHNLWVCPTRFLTVKALSTRRRFVVTSIGDRIV